MDIIDLFFADSFILQQAAWHSWKCIDTCILCINFLFTDQAT